MQTKTISLSNLSQYFHIPVGCPWPTDGSVPDNNRVRSWMNTDGKNASSYQKTSYGTYAGLAAVVIGAVIGLIGFAKDNKFCKFIGTLFAGVGAVASLIGKFCGFEFDLPGKISNKVIFNPPTSYKMTPEQLGLKYKEVKIDLPESECLHGYFIPAPVETTKTVIFLHGRANNISHCLGDVKALQEKVPVNVLMMDYRGFGKSVLRSSAITHEGVVSDAVKMYDFLRGVKINGKEIRPEDISLFGHSIGGAVAIEVATQRKVRALIVQSSFTSIKNIIEDFRTRGIASSFLQKIVPESISSYLTNGGDFNSVEMMRKVQADHICVSHSMDDPLIGAEHSEKLMDAARSSRKATVNYFLLEHGGHSDFCKEYTDYHYAVFRRLTGTNDAPLREKEREPAIA